MCRWFRPTPPGRSATVFALTGIRLPIRAPAAGIASAGSATGFGTRSGCPRNRDPPPDHARLSAERRMARRAIRPSASRRFERLGSAVPCRSPSPTTRPGADNTPRRKLLRLPCSGATNSVATPLAGPGRPLLGASARRRQVADAERPVPRGGRRCRVGGVQVGGVRWPAGPTARGANRTRRGRGGCVRRGRRARGSRTRRRPPTAGWGRRGSWP